MALNDPAHPPAWATRVFGVADEPGWEALLEAEAMGVLAEHQLGENGEACVCGLMWPCPDTRRIWAKHAIVFLLNLTAARERYAVATAAQNYAVAHAEHHAKRLLATRENGGDAISRMRQAGHW